MNGDSVRRDLCGLTHALATIILLNDDAAVAPGGRSARALPVAASCCRRRRAPGASAARAQRRAWRRVQRRSLSTYRIYDVCCAAISVGFFSIELSCKSFLPTAKSAHEIQHDISLSLHLYILSITANDMHCRTRPWSETGASVAKAASSSGPLTNSTR